MKVYFLESNQPLTKSFSLGADNSIIKSNYPNVYEVTSHEEDICSVSELMTAIEKHAAAGHCLLKGALSRPLVRESRAGATTNQAMTGWICLDLDGVHAQDIDSFLAELGLTGVDYGVQWSASSGVVAGGGLRCHVFVLLEVPVSVSSLKVWLQEQNFRVPILAANIGLSSTGFALKYPLDITVCQEDKIIYVAPPIFGVGIKDPFEGRSRYETHKRGLGRFKFDSTKSSPGAVKSHVEEKISALRKSRGLGPRKSLNTKTEHGITYLPKPDQVSVTGVKTERGFTYLNLNGGDSWGYYHPNANIKFIYNFKGEPNYLAEELCPDYYRQQIKRVNTGTVSTYTTEGEVLYLAFRDFDTSTFYNAIYKPGQQELKLAAAKSEKQLRDFMAEHGQTVGSFIPTWTMKWDPSDPVVLDPKTQTLNYFVPSACMKAPVDPNQVTCPPLIERVIKHMIAYDQPTYEWVINWLAFIYQRRELTRVGLLTHGNQGTGKGVFYHLIVSHLLGGQNVTSKRLEELESQFTGFLDSKLFAMIDEIQVSSTLFSDKVTAKLKNIMVEPMVSVRDLFKSAVMKKNYCNYFFASNKLDPIELSPDDRRFTIAPPQYTPLLSVMSSDEIDRVPTQVPAFASYLSNFRVDELRARTALKNEAKRFMIQLNRQSADAVADALLEGNLQFLIDALPADVVRSFDPHYLPTAQYITLIDSLVQSGETRLSRDDLQVVFRYLVGRNVPDSPHKFTTYLRFHRINMESIWLRGKTITGLQVKSGWLPIAQDAAAVTSALAAKLK